MIEQIEAALAKPWTQVAIGFALFLAGVLVSYIYYRLSLRRTALCYHRSRERLLGYENQTLPAEVEFRYRGELVQRLDRLVLIFWNDGNTTISDSDRVAGDPLRISGRIKVLDARIIKTSRSIIDPKLTISSLPEYLVRIEFDFLDSNDGFVIELLYEYKNMGDAQEKIKGDDFFKVEGSFRGMPKGIKSMGLPLIGVRDVGWERWGPPLGGIMILAMSSVFIYGGIEKTIKLWPQYLQVIIPILAIPIGLFGILIGVVLLWFSRRRYPQSLLIPRTDVGKSVSN